MDASEARKKRVTKSRARAPLTTKPKKVRFTSRRGSTSGVASEAIASQVEGAASVVPSEVPVTAPGIGASASAVGDSASIPQSEIQGEGAKGLAPSATPRASISNGTTMQRAFSNIPFPDNAEKFVGA